MLTARNVFHHCLIDLSPNRWRLVDDKNGVDTVSVLPAEFAWPYGAIYELGLISLGKVKEHKNYFYTFCKLKPRSWSSKSARDPEGSANTPMIIVSVDNRLIGDASIIHVVEESLGESTSFSREIGEFMNV